MFIHSLYIFLLNRNHAVSHVHEFVSITCIWYGIFAQKVEKCVIILFP